MADTGARRDYAGLTAAQLEELLRTATLTDAERLAVAGELEQRFLEDYDRLVGRPAPRGRAQPPAPPPPTVTARPAVQAQPPPPARAKPRSSCGSVLVIALVLAVITMCVGAMTIVVIGGGY